MTHSYQITGMHCGSCVARVTSALEGVEGVTSAKVTLDPPRADVAMREHVAMGKLDAAVQRAGAYHVSDMLQQAVSDNSAHASVGTTTEPKKSLYPLVLIVAYILGTVLIVAWASGVWVPMVLMRHFMAGFFLVFSFFKLLDLRGFADAYRMYDVVARPVPAWGYLYPFVELGLGVAYLTNVAPLATNVVTLMLMLIGAVGVLQSLLQKRAIRCACLGTALNLPMTTVTLVEDLGMAAMAAVMLLA